MNNELIEKIKDKREFRKLPNSLVEGFARKCNWDIKETRANLRKYFGVFLTNKVLKSKNVDVLERHISSKKRNYNEFYKKIFSEGKSFYSVVDFGCGVNGYSLLELHETMGALEYLGIEASGQIVDNVNDYFSKSCQGYKTHVFCEDLFRLDKMKGIVKNSKVNGSTVIFMFQIIDALECLEKNFSKKFILEISSELNGDDMIVITLPIESLSGKTNFVVRRKWLVGFLEENFKIEKDFLMNGERIFVVRKN